ncbi:MFS transporter [Streptomyces malaysiensis]|uniref:MFS transporter n=1 Tax=Streptomyces malaysiensis subsp. samsunensis TaxID=459658 RepID=A0A9X2M1Y2_STRMQ|nr:MFS transporter [Streptomyces samsunensis]MCQ8834845.1 MFS transporter [Streptomyces samsunensis]
MSLMKHQGFRHLWVAQSASQFGTYVSRVVLPLVAATTLSATPFELGALYAIQSVAFLVIGLPAGVWVDRMRPRTVMVTADIVRAALLASIPLAWWAGALTMVHLLAVGLLLGFASVMFDVAYLSFLPALVKPENLMAGNARLETSRSVPQVAGPAAGGSLAGLLSAVNAVGVQVLCYVVSAVSLSRIRQEVLPVVRERAPMLPEIAAGLRYVFTDPLMRAVTCCSATFNLCYAIASPLLVVMLVDELKQPEWAVGALMAAGGIGGLAGAMTSRMVAQRLGSARVMWLALVTCMPFGLLMPLSSSGWGVLLFAVPWFVLNYGLILYNVAQISFRQQECPPEMMTRMNATVRFLIWGVLPLGGMAGGALGDWAGARTGLAVAAAGMLFSALWVLASPLRTMRELPAVPATA